MNEDVRPPEALPVLRRRSLASRAKPYLRDIDRQVEDGAPLEEAIAALAEKGIQVSKLNLKQMLYRERKLWRRQASEPVVAMQQHRPAAPLAVATLGSRSPPASAASDEKEVAAPPDMDRLEAALDPKRRAEKADRYLNRTRSIIGRNAKGETE